MNPLQKQMGVKNESNILFTLKAPHGTKNVNTHTIVRNAQHEVR